MPPFAAVMYGVQTVPVHVLVAAKAVRERMHATAMAHNHSVSLGTEDAILNFPFAEENSGADRINVTFFFSHRVALVCVRVPFLFQFRLVFSADALHYSCSVDALKFGCK